MSTKAMKILLIIFSTIFLVLISVFGTLGIQKLYQEETAPVPAPAPVPPEPLMAQVIAVNPNYVNVSKPVKSCSPSQQVVYTEPQKQGIPGAGAVIGGIAGGFLGSAVNGKNKDVAIGIGAAAGALTGNAVQNNMKKQPQAHTVTRQHCTTHYVSTPVQKGYQVTYLLDGQQGMMVMDQPPQSPFLPLPIQGNGQQVPVPGSGQQVSAGTVAQMPLTSSK